MNNTTDGKIWFGMGLKNDDLRADAEKSKQIFRDLSNSAQREGERMDSIFKKTAAAAAAIFTAQQAVQVIKSIVDVTAEFQKYEAVLRNALGSQQKAAEAMKLIKEIAATTPFGVDELTASFIKLVNQGFQPTREQIISLGDLAAAQGKSFDQLTEAIIDAQTGEFERLKEFGIRASKEGDNVAFTFRGITKEVKFTGDAIRDYLLSLGNMDGIAGGMEAISKTIGGQISNLQDSIQNMFQEIGNDNAGIVSDVISGASFIVDHYKEIGDILKVLVVTYGSYKAAIIATLAIERAQIALDAAKTWLSLAASIRTAKDAQALLNLTMAANPIGLVVAAIAGLITALKVYGDSASASEMAQKNLDSALKDATGSVIEQKVKIGDLIKQIENENLTNEQRMSALTKLKGITNGRLDQLTIEAFKTGEATAAINDYIAALDREAKAKAYQDTKIANYKRLQQINDAQKAGGVGWGQIIVGGLVGGGATAGNLYYGKKQFDSLENEKKALEQQNKSIDDELTKQIESENKRANQQKQSVVKNKQYYEGLKKDAQSRLDALSDVQAKGAAGQKIIKEIQGYDKILNSYSVGATNKSQAAAAKQQQADDKRNLDEQKRLNDERADLVEQTNRKLDDLRIARLSGIDKDKAVIDRDYTDMVEAFKKLGILNKENQALLDNWRTQSVANVTAQENQKTTQDNAQWYAQAIADYADYESKKLAITEKYKEERKRAIENGQSDLLDGINEAESREHKALQASNSEKLASAEKYTQDIIYLTKKAAQQQLEILNELLKSGGLPEATRSELQKKADGLTDLLKKPLKEFSDSQIDTNIAEQEKKLAELAATGDITSDAFNRINDNLARLKALKAENSIKGIENALSVLNQLAPAFNDLSSALNETGNNTAQQLGGVFANLASGGIQLLETFKKIKLEGVTTIDAIGAAAQFVISTIASIVSSTRAQKKAYEEFYLQNLSFQHDYNNALLDEIRLREGIKDSVFFTDYAGKIKAGLAAEIKAVNDYNEALSKLQDAQVITGTKKVRDWAAVAGSTLSGAGTGAVVGAAGGPLSAVGAAIGAAVGFIGGMLKKRTVVNIYDNLLKTYPKLIDEQGNLNKLIAESIISSGKIEGSSRENLQYLISMNEQYEKAKDQIEGVISDLAGSLGSDLMSSLFDDWANGGKDAGNAFANG